MNTNSAIVPGSLAAVANRDGLSLAESFVNCEILVLIDQSGSMAAKDAPNNLSRFDAADNELAKIQRANPGKVGVVSFSSTVQFCPGGRPYRECATTDMAAALRFVQIVDGASRIVLISDGSPNSQKETLAVARQFKNPIHTIYIGPEDGDGRDFLEQLAAATGGKTFKRAEANLLADSVQLLLAA